MINSPILIFSDLDQRSFRFKEHKLTTQVTNLLNDEEPNILIHIQDVYGTGSYTVTLCDGAHKIGQVTCRIVKNEYIYIDHIENLDKNYKKVGTALIEYIFRSSLDNDLGGKISLCAQKSSHLFYYKLGFNLQLRYFGSLQREIESNYFRSKSLSSVEKNILEESIKSHTLYTKIKDNAQNRFDSCDLSFDQIMEGGLYDYQTFSELLSQQTLSCQRVDTSEIGAVMCDLPSTAIDSLKIKFKIDDAMSAQSHYAITKNMS